VEFRWNEWNAQHIARHGIQPEEAEWVAEHCAASDAGEDKYRARGQTQAGRYRQVVFVIGGDGRVFVIHARDLTDREKRRIRRHRR
jgi:uncharacterized protein